MDSSYAFPVEKQPLYIYSGKTKVEVPNRLAIVRTDTNTPLGIVSEKYEFMKHETVVDGFRDALKGHAFKEHIALERDGAQLYARYTLKDVQAEVKKGDIVGMQLLARNSYDGSLQLHLSMGSLRLVCQNGMVSTRNFIDFSHKHVGSDMNLNLAEMRSSIDGMVKQFEEIIPSMKRLSAAHSAKTDEQFFDPKNIKLPSYILEKAKDRYAVDQEAGDGLWKMYNALTWAITHQMRKEAPALQQHYGQVAWSAVSRELEATR